MIYGYFLEQHIPACPSDKQFSNLGGPGQLHTCLVSFFIIQTTDDLTWLLSIRQVRMEVTCPTGKSTIKSHTTRKDCFQVITRGNENIRFLTFIQISLASSLGSMPQPNRRIENRTKVWVVYNQTQEKG